MNVLSCIKSLFGFKKEKKVSYRSPLQFNEETHEMSISLEKLSHVFAGEDLRVGSGGGYEISKEYEDEKTEIYDFLCNLAIRQEEEKMVLVKIIRRVTVYRNKNGRLVNVNIGDTQEIVKPFPF